MPVHRVKLPSSVMFTERGGWSVRQRAPSFVGLKLTSQLMFPEGERNSPPVGVCIATNGVGTPGTVVEVGELVVVGDGALDVVVEAALVLVEAVEAVPGPELQAASSSVAPSATAPDTRRREAGERAASPRA